jgi:hypothetical protein
MQNQIAAMLTKFGERYVSKKFYPCLRKLIDVALILALEVLAVANDYGFVSY